MAFRNLYIKKNVLKGKMNKHYAKRVGFAAAVISMGLLAGCGKATAVSGNGIDENGQVIDSASGDINSDDTSNNAANGSSNGNSGSSTNNNGVGTPPVIAEDGTVISYGTSAINTGNLTETGNGYEGIQGTGKYNYGEALQKSLLFYELQRSGDLPDETRCNWRGDSALKDGQDNGLDLTGGWFDAGDNVKFNLPMAYSAAMLGWSIYEDKDSYVESGQLEYALGNIKWANDYFIKCHPSDEVYYYQVGSGSQDHTWWGPAELVETRMDRPSYCVTKSSPGSTVTGETAASLAICSIVYADIDPSYSALCLSHAESLYKFAEDTKSDAGYTEANGFYNSWSGYNDELAWAGAWLYIATNNDSYLTKAKQYYTQADQNHKWAMCWDDVHIGAAVMLARLTGDSTYSQAVEKHLDWWTTGVEGERITYTPQGLAWLDNWGSLRYATTTGFIAAIYSEMDCCSSGKASTYWDFAVAQANYALGDTGFSYLIGFGDDYPVNPHHRTAQGSYMDNMNEPATARHTLYGALVGGPDASDNYSDDVSNYNNNEVACDYNAGFTGLLAKLYGEYHGQTLVDFGAVEPIECNELFVEGGVNVEGQDFVEIRAFVYNESAWPARAAKNVELRYYIDLSECINAGGSAGNIEVTTNYMQSGSADGIKVWDEENNIYYLSVSFTEGDLYPGGQSQYKKEIQVRMRNPEGPWDNSNDPSFAGLSTGSSVLATGMALYENGVLVFGSEPPAGENAGQSVGVSLGGNNSNGSANGGSTSSAAGSQNGTASNENVAVTIEYSERSSSASSISGTINIKNTSDGSVALKDLAVLYYFTKDSEASLNFSCYHAAINGANGSYKGLNSVSGAFTSNNADDADTLCTITCSDNAVLEVGDTLTINFCINHSDWSNFTTSNDYSGKDVENIVITGKSGIIFGTRP